MSPWRGWLKHRKEVPSRTQHGRVVLRDGQSVLVQRFVDVQHGMKHMSRDLQIAKRNSDSASRLKEKTKPKALQVISHRGSYREFGLSRRELRSISTYDCNPQAASYSLQQNTAKQNGAALWQR